MAYATRYRLEFSDLSGIDCRLDIQEKGYVGGFTQLKGTDNPVILGSINNDENKFTPIRGQRLVINLISNGAFTLESLYSEEDDFYRIEFYRDEKIVFIGFVVQDDCSEDYQDAPYIITLEAIDNLGIIKDIEFLKMDESPFEFQNLLIDYISTCLRKTGLELPIRAYYNLYEEGSGTVKHTFNNIKTHALSFQKDEDTFLSCYEVLERLLSSLGCYLFQTHGRWNIVRIQEMQKEVVDFTEFSYDGFQQTAGSESFPATVAEDIKAVFEDMRKSVVRPYKSTSLQFDYNYPNPLIPNLNLKKGTVLLPISNPDRTGYTTPYWSATNNAFNPVSSPNITFFAFGERDNIGRETDRYIEIANSGGNTSNTNLVRTEVVEVTKGDRVNISFSYRSVNSVNTTQGIMFRTGVIFESDTGYRRFMEILGDGSVIWKDAVRDLPTFYEDRNSTEESSFSNDTAVFPDNGKVYLYFGLAFEGTNPSQLLAVRYKNIRLEYFTEGLSITISGHKWTALQNKLIKNETERNVYLSDHSRKITNGVLFRNDGVTLTTKWFEKDTPDVKYELIEANALGLFNAYFRKLVKMEGTLYGLTDNNNFTISLLQMFNFSTLQHRYFIPLALQEINFRTLTFRALLLEHRSDLPEGSQEQNLNGEQAADSRTFSYIFENVR